MELNYEKIGARIKEQRKHVLRVSQEKMAEDLRMYQADISNLERAQDGGVYNLEKLAMVAEYLGVSLEYLIFGMGGQNVKKYHGEAMQIKKSKKKASAVKTKLLLNLLGLQRKDDDELIKPTYECGPYEIYLFNGALEMLGNQGIEGTLLVKEMIYVFYESEVVAVMTADRTTIMEHVYQPTFMQLQQYIQHDVLDVTDVLRTLNPYWALYRFVDDDNKEQYFTPMLQRMDQLRQYEDKNILYLESIYVREDFRQNGIFRMLIDLLKMTHDKPIMWLNMEPTSGDELDNERANVPYLTPADVGQVNINAAIAEKLGFTVDPDTWHRQVNTITNSGEVKVQVKHIRKCAYIIPDEIQEIILNDGDLVAEGRAIQKLSQTNEEAGGAVDLRSGIKDGYVIQEMQFPVDNNPYLRIVCYAALSINDEKTKYGVSYRSAFHEGMNHEGQLEEYEYLDEALDSEYFDKLDMLNHMTIPMLHELRQKKSIEVKNEFDSTVESSLVFKMKTEVGFDDDPVEGFFKQIGIFPQILEEKLHDQIVQYAGEKDARKFFSEVNRRASIDIKDSDNLDFYAFRNKTLELGLTTWIGLDGSYIRKMLIWICEHKDLFKGEILDLGCDTGVFSCFLAELFPDCHVTGVDRCQKAIQQAKKLAKGLHITNVEFIDADFYSSSKQYDTVFSSKVLGETFDGFEVFPVEPFEAIYPKYKDVVLPYAELLSKLLKEGGKVISSELLSGNPLFYAWLEAIRDVRLRTNLQLSGSMLSHVFHTRLKIEGLSQNKYMNPEIIDETKEVMTYITVSEKGEGISNGKLRAIFEDEVDKDEIWSQNYYLWREKGNLLKGYYFDYGKQKGKYALWESKAIPEVRILEQYFHDGERYQYQVSGIDASETMDTLRIIEHEVTECKKKKITVGCMLLMM